MNGYVPPGMLSLGAALAQAAEALCPDAWASATASARGAFTADSAAGKSRGFWGATGSLASRAYVALRPMLADGRLPASLRKIAGAPEPIEPASWQASGADRVADVLSGTVKFTLASGEVARGDVLIRASDLDAALAGKVISPPAIAALPRPVATVDTPRGKPGRRGNPEADNFWIEVCRLAANGDIRGGQAGMTAHMAQWSENHMTAPYDAETVRKKVGNLFRTLGWHESDGLGD